MEIIAELVGILRQQSEMIEGISRSSSSQGVVDKNIIQSKGSTFGSSSQETSQLSAKDKTKVSEIAEIMSNVFLKKNIRKETSDTTNREKSYTKTEKVTSSKTPTIKSDKTSLITRVTPKPISTSEVVKPSVSKKVVKVLEQPSKVVKPKLATQPSKVVKPKLATQPEVVKPKLATQPEVVKPSISKILAPKLSNSPKLEKLPKAIPIKSKPSTLDGVEKSRTVSWAKIVIGEFFDEQRRQKKDTKLKTLTSKPKGRDGFGEFSSSPKKGKDNGKDDGKDNTSGGFLSSLAAILGAKILTSLKGVVSNVFGKPLQALKNFKTRAIKKLTPKVVRNSMAAYKKFKRNITPKKVANFIANKSSKLVSSAAGGISKAAGSVGRVASSALGGISKAAGGISKAVSGAGGARKLITNAVGSVSKAASSAVGVVKTKAIDSAKSLVKTNIKNILPSPKAIPKLFGGTLSKAPIIGPAITAAFAAYDIKGMKDKYNKGEITKDELQKDAGKRIITAITGAIGSAGGALLGGALGTLIPIPLVGTSIGYIVGTLGGALAGEYLGGLISDYIIPEKYTKSIGAFFTNTEPPTEEMQDWIIKDGKIYKFSNKDEVMGIKSGGAINQFLASKPDTGGVGMKVTRSTNQDSTLSTLTSINSIANDYLRVIMNNTTLMLKNNSNNQYANTTQSNNKVSPMKSSQTPPQMVPISNNRSGYTNSHYSLA
jgi:hypothetical protein